MSASAFVAKDTNPLFQWTCEDFLAIDDAFYQTAIGAAEIITLAINPPLKLNSFRLI